MNIITDIINFICKEYQPVKGTLNGDQHLLVFFVIGGILITITFATIGLLCIVMAGKDKEQQVAYKQRKLLTRLFGLFLLSCAFARGLEVLSLWHNYAIMTVILKMLTGIVALITVGLTPSILREMRKRGTIDEVKASILKTNEKLDKIKDMTDKLTQNDR